MAAVSPYTTGFAPEGVLYSKVELSISCKNLKDLDFFSKSDPVVFLYERNRQKWTKLGRTEVIDNNLNPKFSKTFLLEYRFEEVQDLKFVVYDVDDRRHVEDLSRHDLIGEVQCTLADVVTAGQQFTRTVKFQGASRGQIFIVAEEVQDSKFIVNMQLTATKLDKKDLFGKSDPFFEIHKAQEGAGFSVIYRSQPVKKTLNPKWPTFSISARQLCSGDWDRTLKFVIWDWNRSGNHDYIGSCTATLRDICPEKGGQVFCLDIINEMKKNAKKKYHNSGTFNFAAVKLFPENTFLDYIMGGYEISLMVAIDFTASNGEPEDPSSLHYCKNNKDSAYMTAIRSVGSILAPYDSNQLIPMFGFGAGIPPAGKVSHCFPLTFREDAPAVLGVQGMMDAYRYALSQVDLHGPTNFSSFLFRAIEMARHNITQKSQIYTILLVITDGVISDMSRTIDRIVEASKLPLSIVIVGVGQADFKNMEILDADNEPLRNGHGEYMARDIVQFVPYKKYEYSHTSLARETLAEIPGQFLSFMKENGIKPNPSLLQTRQTTFIQSSQPGPCTSNAASCPSPFGSTSKPQQDMPPPYSYSITGQNTSQSTSQQQQSPPYPM